MLRGWVYQSIITIVFAKFFLVRYIQNKFFYLWMLLQQAKGVILVASVSSSSAQHRRMARSTYGYAFIQLLACVR